MANKTIPMELIRRIIQLKAEGRSNRAISKTCQLSRTTVDRYVSRLETSGKSREELLQLSDDALVAYSIAQGEIKDTDEKQAVLSDLIPSLVQQLNKPKVTRMILWEEYRRQYPQGYSYTQFCEYLSRYIQRNSAVMHLEHQPGEELYFDFAGDPLYYLDTVTGERVKCPVFIAVLPFSGYTYVEALPNAGRNQLLGGMNNMMSFFGGVTASVKTDNMAQCVKKTNRYEPAFDELVLQWSTHYNTTLLATRVAKPRDKASVESHVNTVYHRIYAGLHKYDPHSLAELNQYILVELDKLNRRNFQGRDHSRSDKFLQYEKPLLKPLPPNLFVPKTTIEATVQKNYHIMLGEDKHYYSVPYTYIGKRVKVIYDIDNVEIYLAHQRIAFYKRNYRSYGYSTIAEHMPPNHLHYAENRGWTPEYLLEKAQSIGPNTAEVISALLKQKIFREQMYNSCLGILRFAEKYSPQRLEAACHRALKVTKVNYTLVRDILDRNLDQASSQDLFASVPQHENLRGKSAYEN